VSRRVPVLAAVAVTVLAWASAFVAIRGVGRDLSPGALALGRLLVGMLYGVQPTDPGVLAAVCLVLGTASILACLVPAIRATRVNPVDALRSE